MSEKGTEISGCNGPGKAVVDSATQTAASSVSLKDGLDSADASTVAALGPKERAALVKLVATLPESKVCALLEGVEDP